MVRIWMSAVVLAASVGAGRAAAIAWQPVRDVAGDDGAWRTVYRGSVYGTIFAKRIDPVVARRVRLQTGGVPVTRLDLFLAKG